MKTFYERVCVCKRLTQFMRSFAESWCGVTDEAASWRTSFYCLK